MTFSEDGLLQKLAARKPGSGGRTGRGGEKLVI